MSKLAYLLFALSSSSSLKSLTMEIREKGSLNLISSKNLSEKDISRLTQTPKHERNHEHLRRSRRSFLGRNDDFCQTRMEHMDSAALKRHLCQKHFENIRRGVLKEYKESEVENRHCASNLIIPHTKDPVHKMPTRCELSINGKSLKKQHSCLKGKHHCDGPSSKELCAKFSIFYEKTLPDAGHTVENGMDNSKCKELLGNNAVFSCDEVRTVNSHELLASKFDFYYIVIKREDSTGELIRSKVEFTISIINHAICGAKLELRQN